MKSKASKIFVPAAAALSLFLPALLLSTTVRAQLDIEPPLPNVLLLVDSSGSMEYLPNGSLPTICDPANPASQQNRWETLVEVLTGTVENRTCYRQDRKSPEFVAEYSLGGGDPYDKNYFLPHHRIVSNGCVPGPGNLPASVYDWPAGAIAYHPWNSPAGAAVCVGAGFVQQPDGLIDIYGNRVRFGLFNFDSAVHPGIGISGAAADYPNGMAGSWSYYLGWQTGIGAQQGHPPLCSLQSMENGARNSAAPPWEGRMMPFGPFDWSATQSVAQNRKIQQSLVVMRPYGNTPLAGQLSDAENFFRNDTSNDPVNGGYKFGPATDAFVVDGCRQQFVIVLSDGEPNSDLRPFCETGDGVCPFAKTHETAASLFNSGGAGSIPVYAVGFGVTSGTYLGVPFDCNALSLPIDISPGGACDGAAGPLKACCNVARIAYEGGTNNPYYADNLASLKAALNTVLAEITANSTSRTVPTFSGAATTLASASLAPAVAYEFTSSFDPQAGSLWSGNLERHRWVCKTTAGVLAAELEPVNINLGDNFAQNINQGKLSKPRGFFTVVGAPISGQIDSEGSIRPHLSTNDGLGLYTGSTQGGGADGLSGIMGAVPEAMGMVPLPPVCLDADLNATNPNMCARRVMKWQLGGDNGGGLPRRVDSAGNSTEFGAIYHANPAVVSAPRAFIRDPSYEVFAAGAAKTRPLMLYSVTTDGQLHAFKVASNDAADATGVLADALKNNELWSFMPPHVLKHVLGQYPNAQAILLDGSPIVKDVVFERTLGQAKKGGIAGGAEWKTVLVAGGRGGGGFYYALDVTDPTEPEFLWQLSHDMATGDPLFGDISGTPTIATVAIKDGVDVKEVAVAILPGGPGTLSGGDCARSESNFLHIDAVYQPRSNVRCWNSGPSRSLTIVRVDTGEVLMSFRGDAADGPANLDASRVKVVGFDSPITGVPEPFPGRVGQVADRVYIGDADGTLWRIDLSHRDPANWEAYLAFDAYPLGTDTAMDGQPVETRTIVSVDGRGNTVLLYSTGEQDTFFAQAAMKTRVWSITEKPVLTAGKPFNTKANWYIPFEDGKRVTGQIALFDQVAFFSTFTPQVGTCSNGFGSIWGVDFRKSVGTLPKPRLPQDPNATPLVFISEDPQPPGTTVFGVAIVQEPPCFETASASDAYMGNYNSITNASPPRFVLNYHTGTGGTAASGAKTKTQKTVLPTPRNSVRIDSWAGVVE